jgi:ribosomal protein S27E
MTRWVGECRGCLNERQVESRSSHAMRVLCDDCAAKPHRGPRTYESDFVE